MYWFIKTAMNHQLPYTGDYEKGVRIGGLKQKENAISKIKTSASQGRAIVLYERDS